MTKILPRYLAWRDGRPRWVPGPGLRPHWKGQDLKDPAGNWLRLEAAIAAAAELNAKVDAWRIGGEVPQPEKPPARTYRSCKDLFDKYWDSVDFTMLAPATQRDYRSKANAFLAAEIDEGGCFRDAPLRAITKPQCFGFWEDMQKSRGLHMANGIKAVVSAAFSYAELCGWREARSNPWREMGRPTAPPRLAIWLPRQIEVFLQAADGCTADDGRDTLSVGDAFLIGLHTGQRLNDVLTMPERIFHSGRIHLTQTKRKALIDLRMTEQVTARFEKIKVRLQELRRDATTPAIGGPCVVNEVTGQAYTPHSFNKRFRKVREVAGELLPKFEIDRAWSGPRVYQIPELRFQDLRDTTVTRLALAECSMAEIASVTGHTLQSITQIMKHYLALNRAMADTAVDRLEAWMKREGVKA